MFDHIGPDDSFGLSLGERVYDYINDRFVRHYRGASQVKAEHLFLVKNMVNMFAMRHPSNTPRRVFDEVLAHADALIEAAFPSE